MTRIERIDDLADPRLRDFVALRDVELRTRSEELEGLFIAEGERTIRRAVAAGYELRAVLLTERWLAALGALPRTRTRPSWSSRTTC